MLQRLHFAWLTTVTLVFVNSAVAQDMRIQTRVYAADAVEPIANCLTLFHAGKVYDYIEPAQEVTIFEPALRKFTVVNKSRRLRSELTQEEIRHYLMLAQVEVEKHLSESALSAKAADFLQFQLHPNMTSTFDATKSQLTLSNGTFQYAVTAFTPEKAGVVENYLHVADWTAQLNSVLHPKTLLPGPRLVLNQELRERGLAPLTVELKTEAVSAIHLTARHEWTWSLSKTDRQLIDGWEMDLKNPAIQKLDFHKFQQEMLKMVTARKR